MSIPISYVVSVNISVADQALSAGDFGTQLNVGTSNVINPIERVRAYFDITTVLNDFGDSAPEYKAALAHFAQNPKPPTYMIGRWVNTNLAAQMDSTPILQSLLSSVLVIADGEFNFGFEGSRHNIIGLDFTAGTSWNDVASIIQTGLQAIGSGGFTSATVTAVLETILGVPNVYFYITSGVTGSSSSIQVAQPVSGGLGTDVSSLLGLNIATELLPGFNSETPVEALTAIFAVNEGEYGVTFTDSLRDSSDVINVANFIEAQTKIYGTTTNDPNTLDSGSTTDVMYELKALGLNRTYCVYHDNAAFYPEVSIMSNMFTVDFASATSSVKTAAFKPVPGITAADVDAADVQVIQTKNGNTVVEMGNLTFYFDGTMSSGRFFDIQQFIDWLQNYIQVNLANLLISSAIIPYTDAGTALLESNVRASLQQGVNNGGLSAGTDAQGNNIPAFTTSVPRVATVPLNQRVNRISPPISFTANASNGIQQVTVNGTINI